MLPDVADLERWYSIGHEALRAHMDDDARAQLLSDFCCAGHAIAVTRNTDSVEEAVRLSVTHHFDHTASVILSAVSMQLLLGYCIEKEIR